MSTTFWFGMRPISSRCQASTSFFSFLVLQHNPPPIMIDILGHAFKGLAPRGLAFFQLLPTYSRDHSFSFAEYWVAMAEQRTMEMHFLPQHIVLELGRRHGVHPLEVQADGAIGHHKCWISSTFLMTKPPSDRPLS